MQKKSVKDVESVLNYLLGVVAFVEGGDRQEFDEGAYDYGRKVLAGAEHPIRQLGMYEATERAINESERMVIAGQFKDAAQVLLDVAREMMEKSGTNDRLRTLYAPRTSKRKQ